MAYTTIDDPAVYFNTVLYTGNAGTQSITGVGFSPALNWIKCRGAAENHAVSDSVRGDSGAASGYYVLYPNLNSAEYGSSGNAYVTALGSDGFSIGNNDVVNIAQPFVSWNWKAGTSFTNDASATGIGTIDSTGSFNNTSGFSIVSYSGTGSAGTIKHGLSTVPKMIIVKSTSHVENWTVYHSSLGGGGYIYINNTDAATTGNTSIWNGTSPTSSVFSVGTDGTSNGSGKDYVGYCFAEVQGYSKFGSYLGNGNTANNTFVYTGFKVGYVLIKRSNSAGEGWFIFDSTRSPANVNVNELRADVDSAEATGSHYIDFLSNGFKPKTNGAGIGGSGDTYIYMAFAENPFVTSTDNGSIPACAR